MIQAIADRHGLAVVEDACQAHGATFRGRRAGSFGHGAFSLYATKNMTTAEGGFVTTNDDKLADWLRLHRNQGMRTRYAVRDARLQLPDDRSRRRDRPRRSSPSSSGTRPRRQAIAASGTTRPSASCRSACPITPDGRSHVFHQYTIDVGGARDAIMADLREAGDRGGHLLPDAGPSAGLHHGARPARGPAGDRGRRGADPRACRCSLA